MKRYFFVLTMTAVLLLNLLCKTAFAEGNFIIRSVMRDDSGNLVLLNGINENKNINFKVSSLSAPDRVVVDIADSILPEVKRSFDNLANNVSSFRIAQFSTNPNIVRVVFNVNSQDSFSKIAVYKSKSGIIFKLNDINKPQKTSSVGTDYRKFSINRIKFSDNSLILSGTGHLNFKQPFVLQNPNRIVYDFPNSSVSSKEFLKTFTMSNKDTFRIGQFSDDTIRVTIDTQKPEIYRQIISPDLQTVILAQKDSVNISDVPDAKSATSLNNIKTAKLPDNKTEIQLSFNKPIVHSFKSNNGAVNLDFYNLYRPKKTVLEHFTSTDQCKEIKSGNIDGYKKGSSLSFSVNKGAVADTSLSTDGKILKIFIKDTINPDLLNQPAAYVVIDAGHGGTDPGAQRAGISEKTINLAVAKKVKEYLTKANVSVVMTREDDSTVSLQDRVGIANNLPKSDAFVSIHSNACESPTVKGIEIYWFTPQSSELAKDVHEKIIQYVNTKDRGTIYNMFYVIKNTNAPSILVEIGFLTNEEERNALLTPERQDATAKGIAKGILGFLKLKSPALSFNYGEIGIEDNNGQ